MAAADPHLNGTRRPLALAACVPLPFLRGGRLAAQTGVTVFYAELLPRLAALGHRVTAWAEAPPAPGATARGLPWHQPGLAVHWFAVDYWPGRRPLDDDYDARVGAAVRRHLSAGCAAARPDLVLIGREILAPAVVDACAPLGLRTVLVAHGVATAALQRPDYPPAAAERLVGALRRVDQIVAVARHLEDALAALGATRVTTIGNVADPERFAPAAADPGLRAALAIDGAAPVVGHVSNLTDHKRAADLVAAAPLVLRAVPDAVFLIVGDGSERAALAAQARRLGVAARVRFAGEVDHARVPAHLNLCDLVAMPSERETLSLVYRETQACGRVLLASDVPAAREAVVDDVTGVLFRRGDVAELAARIIALLRDPERRRRIGAAARAAALAERPDDWIHRYDAVLQRAAAPHP